MNLDHPVISVIGAGAVGGYYGARLAQHGQDVHFLLRSEYDAVRRNGWTVRSCDGDFVVPPGRAHAYDDVGKMPKADLVIVTLKTVSNHLYEPLIRPLLKDDTAILTLQNGLGNEDRLAELFGAERVLGGMAFTCINRTGPGQIHHIDHGIIRLGEFVGGPSERAHWVAQTFRDSKIKCEVLPDLRLGRWQKLVWNATFNGLGAVADLTTDLLIGTGPGMEVVVALINEVIATAKAAGVTLPPNIVQVQIDHTATMGAYRSSMQIDRQTGRPMEVEAILGEPLRVAKKHGVPTPILEGLYHTARAVDAALCRSDPGPRAE
jgi:2-dehydropantoate 2-reductase